MVPKKAPLREACDDAEWPSVLALCAVMRGGARPRPSAAASVSRRGTRGRESLMRRACPALLPMCDRTLSTEPYAASVLSASGSGLDVGVTSSVDSVGVVSALPLPEADMLDRAACAADEVRALAMPSSC